MNAGIRLGYKLDGEICSYRQEGHLLTIAPPRSGKGRDLLVPALLTCQHSCLVVDPKGQLAAVTARRRIEMGQKVYILNPFQVWQKYKDGSPCLERFKHVTFNPLAVLDPSSLGFATDCDARADAIVLEESLGSPNKYFTDSARQLVSGLIMYIVSRLPSAGRNLASLYDIICGDQLQTAVQEALATDDRFIRGRLSRFSQANSKGKKSIGEIVLSAITEVGFMGNKAILNSLRSASPGEYELRFRDLRREPMTVYLILPTEYLGPCSKWFRLNVEAALFDLLHDLEVNGPGRPVLFMLDEFAQLKRLQIIEEAAAAAAGYGVQLWPVLQDLNQLKELYGDRFETFIAGAGVSMWYAPRDNTTAEYVSKLCGETEIGYQKKSVGLQPFGPDPERRLGVNVTWERVARKLRHPDEIRRISNDKMMLFGMGLVMEGLRRSYLDDDGLCGMYDPDPYHLREAPPKTFEEDADDDDEDDDEESTLAQLLEELRSDGRWYCRACEKVFSDASVAACDEVPFCKYCGGEVEGPGMF
jgi:type IV secretion system protein VirD4